MNLADQMRDDHRRDYASSTAMDALRSEIHAFLNDPAKTKRCKATTRAALQEAALLLKSDCDHIVAVWD